MYTSIFRMTKEPFGLMPDSSLLYMTSTHREALAGLRYALLTGKGFTLLTGDAGTGKTTLISHFVKSLPPGFHLVSILNPVLQPDEFIEYLMLQLHIENIPASKAQRIMMLQKWLQQQSEENDKRCVLIIDEAHKLRNDVLEEIRLLGNFSTPGNKVIQIVMAGQSELCDLLNSTEMRQLKQRIAVRLSLQPLSAEQVGEYIAYRWQMSGASEAHPFSPEAIAAISRYAKGIPRIVNAICDNALVLMVAEGKPDINEATIVAACSDLDLVGTHEVPAPPAPAPVAVTAPISVPAPGSGNDTGSRKLSVAPPRHESSSSEVPQSAPAAPFQTLRRYDGPAKRSLLMRCVAKLGFVHQTIC